MTDKPLVCAGAVSNAKASWEVIQWRSVIARVQRLQRRIAKAAEAGRHHKVKALQWVLTHSLDAKLLAVRRVTQNRGANTAGVDGILCRTPKQKWQLAQSLQRRGYRAQPLRRIYIPKKRGSKERRPLSIPTLRDRAMQALYLLALEPLSELNADLNSYGFRPKRCVADAIEQCFKALRLKGSAPYILEGDIKQCFDRINLEWLQTHVPMDKRVLSQWLRAGFMDKHIFYSTHAGVPQGGIASPCLALIALSGLERAVKRAVKPCDKVHVVVYADGTPVQA